MKALIVSGSLDLGAEWFLRKGWRDFRLSKGPWFAVQSMLDALELPTLAALERRSKRFAGAPYRDVVERFLAARELGEVPDLAEVSLATALTKAGVPFEAASFATLARDPALVRRFLAECDVVFLSTTYVKNKSELGILAKTFKRTHNRVVAGGAYVGLIHGRWTRIPEIDLVAIGYGELLVPVLAEWMRTGFGKLEPPPGGRVEERDGNLLLFSGLPESKSLDDFDAPDWTIAMRYHGRQFPYVHYESVRGCPYRCGFCNYPFLFDDNKFRMRSAERIAHDWENLARAGVRYVNCLDSLFTMPTRRLLKLCELLIEKRVDVRWICYARADDLVEPETCELMRRAGCVLVSMGVESGSQAVLDQMDKRTTVEENARGIACAKAAGIAVNATIMVGFPGDTPQRVEETLAFLRARSPDFVSIQPFGVGSERMPALSDDNRRRFGLRTSFDGWLWHAYWRHDTMSAPRAVELGNWLRTCIVEERIALDSSVFYMDREWDRRDRGALLDFQRDCSTGHPRLRKAWRLVRRVAEWNARRDMARMLEPSPGHSRESFVPERALTRSA